MNHLDYDSCPDEIRSLPPDQSSGLLKPLLLAGFGRAGLTFLSSALFILRNLKIHITFTTTRFFAFTIKPQAITTLLVCTPLYFLKEPAQCVRFYWQVQHKFDSPLHAF